MSEIPQKFEDVWVECDMPIERLLAEEKRLDDQADAEGSVKFKRISVPTFDRFDCDNSCRTGIVDLDGDTYEYRYWTKKNEGEFKPSVRIRMQKNLMTGQVDKWIEC